MNARRVFAITRRLLDQFRHDRRTLVLLFVAPLILLTLFYYLLRGGGGQPAMGVVNQDQGPFGAAVAHELLASPAVQASEMSGSPGGSTQRLVLVSFAVAPPAWSPVEVSTTAIVHGALTRKNPRQMPGALKSPSFGVRTTYMWQLTTGAWGFGTAAVAAGTAP